MAGGGPLVVVNGPHVNNYRLPVLTDGDENLALFKPGVDPTRALKVRVIKFLNQGTHQEQRNAYDWLMMTLIFATLTLAILSTVGNGDKRWVLFAIMILEATFLVCLFVEYVLRAWSSTASATYRQSGGLFRYLITANMIVDALIILSSISVIVCLLTNNGNRKIMCLLQLIRLLRIDRKQGALEMFSKSFKNHRKELLTCWYMGFLMVVLISFLVYALESKETGYTVDNLLNGIYWGMVSLTCVGYGDLAPKSAISKVLTCSFAFFGGCFLALPAGIIGSGFAIQVAKQQKEKHVIRRRRPAAIIIQAFWRKYAADKDLPATWLPHIRGREENKMKQQDRKFSTTSERQFLNPRSVNLGVNQTYSPIIPRKFSKSKVVTPCPSPGLEVKFSKYKFVTPCQSPASEVKCSNKIECFEKEDSFQEKRGGPVLNGTWPSSNTSFPAQNESNESINKLTSAEKIALRFIRLLKCIAAAKKFRQVRRPYDERDILDQFASSQIEMYGKLQGIRKQIDIFYEHSNQKISETENRIKFLNAKVNHIERESEQTNKLLRLYFERSGIDVEKYTKK